MTRLACARAKNAGINLPPLLHRVGLKLGDIENDSIPISVASQVKCLNLLAATLADDLLGFHVARDMDLRSTGFLYYVAASAKTLGDGLLNIARYAGSVNEGIEPRVEVGKTLRIGLTYSGGSRQSDRHQVEAWMVALVQFCREMTGRRLRPVHIILKHRRIRKSRALDGFFSRTVEFGAGKDEVLFPGETANAPIVTADPYLNKLLIEHCDRIISSRKTSTGPFRTQVENTIAELLPHGRARVDIVARELGIGARTVRRRLADERTTFARILQELRLDLANQYLAEGNLSVSRIAWLLGYTEVSSFSHAFRRWTGRAPRIDRSERQRSTPPHVRARRVRK